jgi:O-acetyl-ADP-ribose deacetylase (regulator of RNase III)
MSISRNKGNALNLQQGILVHGCNCHGVMGGGIALHIKNKWYDVYKAYKAHQAKVGLRLGDVNFVASVSFQNTPVAKHIHAFTEQLPAGVIVANAMTQQDFGSDPNVVYVSYDAIEAAFARIALVARAAQTEVHFPLIGCGLANGKWAEVGTRIEDALRDVPGHLWEL